MPFASIFTEKVPGIRLLNVGLPQIADLLLPEDIVTLGADGILNPEEFSTEARPVYLCGCVSSSMDIAHVLASCGKFPIGASVLASCQRAGKGQLGRHWFSPLGNVYAALRLPQMHPFNMSAAAPAMGGLLAQALVETGIPVRMKWPNDMVNFLGPPQPLSKGAPTAVRREWRKLGGVLIEERKNVIIAGIGLNLVSAPPLPELRKNYSMPAGTLMQAVSSEKIKKLLTTPLKLWVQLTHSIFEHYESWTLEKSWLELAERHLAFRGRNIVFKDDKAKHQSIIEDFESGTYQGTLEGLDPSGGLRIHLSIQGRTKVFLSGSLLLPWMDDTLATEI